MPSNDANQFHIPPPPAHYPLPSQPSADDTSSNPPIDQVPTGNSDTQPPPTVADITEPSEVDQSKSSPAQIVSPPAVVAIDSHNLSAETPDQIAPPYYQPPAEAQVASHAEVVATPTGVNLSPDQTVVPLSQHQPPGDLSENDSDATTLADAPPDFVIPSSSPDSSGLPFTPIPEPDLPDDSTPDSDIGATPSAATDQAQSTATIAKYHPHPTLADATPPRVADKFEHSQHTYQPAEPVDVVPPPIGHTDPRNTTHPLDAGREDDTSNQPIESLSFDEIKVDPVPKSPVPSQLPPNPLLGSDHKQSEPAQPTSQLPATDFQPSPKKVEFHPPVNNFERMKIPFIVGAVSIVLLAILIIPLWFSMGGGDKKPTNSQAVTTLKNLPSGYISVDRGCYSIALPKDNTVPLSNNCALAGSFGGDSNNNISIIPQTKAYNSSDSYYHDATKAPNQLQEISKSTILLDGLPATKVIHNIGSGSDVQKQLSIYVVTSIKGYKVGTTKIEGFEITMSYNNPVSESVAEQVMSLWRWH